MPKYCKWLNIADIGQRALRAQDLSPAAKSCNCRFSLARWTVDLTHFLRCSVPAENHSSLVSGIFSVHLDPSLRNATNRTTAQCEARQGTPTAVECHQILSRDVRERLKDRIPAVVVGPSPTSRPTCGRGAELLNSPTSVATPTSAMVWYPVTDEPRLQFVKTSCRALPVRFVCPHPTRDPSLQQCDRVPILASTETSHSGFSRYGKLSASAVRMSLA